MEPTRDEAAAAARYEDAEEAFLAGLRTGQDRRSLTDLADAVAARAEAWNAAAYRAYHESIGDERDSLDYLTERTEVLEYLWFDIAGALHGREATHDG